MKIFVQSWGKFSCNLSFIYKISPMSIYGHRAYLGGLSLVIISIDSHSGQIVWINGGNN